MTPDSGVEYLDESYSSVHFNIEEPADDASEAELAAWDALNPQTESIDWASVDVVRAGESTWTQYATPEGAQNDREEENSNTEARREFFERVDVDWNGTHIIVHAYMQHTACNSELQIVLHATSATVEKVKTNLVLLHNWR